jgi:hypothetical protein
MWYEIFNDVFWISISTGFFAFLTVVIKTALKSKCDQTNLCFGCITIHRRVELETDDVASSRPGVQDEFALTPSRSGAVQLNRV